MAPKSWLSFVPVIFSELLIIISRTEITLTLCYHLQSHNISVRHQLSERFILQFWQNKMKICMIDDNVDCTQRQKIGIVFDKKTSLKRECLICADTAIFVVLWLSNKSWLILNVTLSIFSLTLVIPNQHIWGSPHRAKPLFQDSRIMRAAMYACHMPFASV